MARQAIKIALDRNDFQVIEKPPLWQCDEVLSATFGSRVATRRPVSHFDPDSSGHSSGPALTFTLLHIKVLLRLTTLYVLPVDEQCQEKKPIFLAERFPLGNPAYKWLIIKYLA
jgi:hypothetical protein